MRPVPPSVSSLSSSSRSSSSDYMSAPSHMSYPRLMERAAPPLGAGAVPYGPGLAAGPPSGPPLGPPFGQPPAPKSEASDADPESGGESGSEEKAHWSIKDKVALWCVTAGFLVIGLIMYAIATFILNHPDTFHRDINDTIPDGQHRNTGQGGKCFRDTDPNFMVSIGKLAARLALDWVLIVIIWRDKAKSLEMGRTAYFIFVCIAVVFHTAGPILYGLVCGGKGWAVDTWLTFIADVALALAVTNLAEGIQNAI